MQQLEFIGELVTSFGLGALIVIGYGLVLRHLRGHGMERYASAILFSCGAIAAMMNPVTLNSGYVFDARAVFIALAGPFGGAIAGVITGVAAGLTRFLIGGSGTFAGIAGIAVAMAAGVIFARFGPRRQTLRSLAILGLGTATMVFSLLLTDIDTAGSLFRRVGLPLTLVNILGVMLLGYVLEGTRRGTDHLRVVEFNADRDPLTNLFNRRALAQFAQNLRRQETGDTAHGCVVLFDIDRFKSVNDRYGHARGDVVLRTVADTITHRVRRSDVAVRYGGEEIAVILIGTAIDDARRVAEQIRRVVEELVFEHENQHFSVTVSAGISAFDADGTQLEHALDFADRALYRAKNAGRNRTETLLVPGLEVVSTGSTAS